MADLQPIKPNDVAKPGTTPAPATSRPVIVGNTPQVADPMLERSAKQVAPLAVNGSSMKDKVVSDETPETLKKEASSEDDAKHAQQNPLDKPKDEVDKLARLGEIIESGEYNVNISSRDKNGAKSAGIILLIVLLIAIVGYILVDLNIIHTNFSLPFEIFK